MFRQTIHLTFSIVYCVLNETLTRSWIIYLINFWFSRREKGELSINRNEVTSSIITHNCWEGFFCVVRCFFYDQAFTWLPRFASMNPRTIFPFLFYMLNICEWIERQIFWMKLKSVVYSNNRKWIHVNEGVQYGFFVCMYLEKSIFSL